jgi:prolipoprotein diacylglyceryltransferase
MVGHLAGRRQRTGGIGHSLFDMLLVGLLAARIAFVARWFDAYRQAPWTMLDIRDGGFTPWAGVAAALLVAVWQGWRRASLREPLVLVLVLGLGRPEGCAAHDGRGKANAAHGAADDACR